MKKRFLKLTSLLLILVMLFSFQIAASAAKNPVVCVHGWTQNGSNFDSIRDNLESNGWTDTYAINYPNPYDTYANDDNAELLSDFIDDVLQETGASQVDIIAHSMGGISSRYYLQDLGGDSKVGSIVTLGTPHHGTYAGTGDLSIYSLFLAALNAGDTTPGSVNCTSIYSTTDELVVPQVSAYMSGWNNVTLTGYTHFGLLSSSIVNAYIRANLTQ